LEDAAAESCHARLRRQFKGTTVDDITRRIYREPNLRTLDGLRVALRAVVASQDRIVEVLGELQPYHPDECTSVLSYIDSCDLGKLLLEVDHLAEAEEIRLERQARRSHQQ
jgi:hypothetical protein